MMTYSAANKVPMRAERSACLQRRGAASHSNDPGHS